LTRILSQRPHSSLRKIIVLFSILLGSTGILRAELSLLEKRDLQWLGDRIFRNECNRRAECLTSWNEGEEFPSLGIGHFIWYRADQAEIYEEAFPSLMAFMAREEVEIPLWIVANDLEAPWADRTAFLADLESDRMQELRSFLLEHQQEQTAYIVSRHEEVLLRILKSINEPALKARVEKNFSKVASSNPPYGLYALIDYNHFKGSGISPEERYQDKGWGLKQVLLEMNSSDESLVAFVQAAREVLTRRVENAPASRNESRWLQGWLNRLNTYLAQ